MAMRLTNFNWLYVIIFTVALQSCSTAPKKTDELITISTRLGDIKLILFNDTPIHKKSFLELTERGAYDSTTFYRVLKQFMIQGGNFANNPQFEKDARRLIPAEIVPNRYHKRGMLAAARQTTNRNPLKKSSTQFYIVQGKVFSRKAITTKIEKLNNTLPKYLYDGTHQELIDKFKVLQDSSKFDELQDRILDLREEMEAALDMDFENEEISEEQIEAYTTVGGAPHLDGGYTVFGQVVEGMETVDKIADLEVDSLNNPIEKVYMQIKIEEVSQDSITIWYGIEYPKPEKK
ncbi:MAG: peptidylprolyl isomerase [Bacteroidetes bacterium]|nr:MAG: peptidylprolyl isomerase [Bacteroidota bacterium]